MSEGHRYAAEFITRMAETQRAYTERRIEDYLASWSEDYFSVQLGTEWSEDKAALAAKMQKDAANFELLRMDFEVLRSWFIGEQGFAHLAYHTRLRTKSNGRVLVDRRENIIVGNHLGSGRWQLISKIVVKAENYYEKDDARGDAMLPVS